MSKTQIVEELIRTHSPDLMLTALWEDETIVNRIRTSLMAISVGNLDYYTNQFIGEKLLSTEKIQPKHIPLFKGEATAKYVAKLHES